MFDKLMCVGLIMVMGAICLAQGKTDLKKHITEHHAQPAKIAELTYEMVSAPDHNIDTDVLKQHYKLFRNGDVDGCNLCH